MTMPMNTPISVPPRALWRCGPRDKDERRVAVEAVIEGSHLVRCSDPQDGEAVAQHLPGRDDQREPRLAHAHIVDEEALGIIVTVEFLRQILQVERQLMGREL